MVFAFHQVTAADRQAALALSVPAVKRTSVSFGRPATRPFSAFGALKRTTPKAPLTALLANHILYYLTPANHTYFRDQSARSAPLLSRVIAGVLGLRAFAEEKFCRVFAAENGGPEPNPASSGGEDPTALLLATALAAIALAVGWLLFRGGRETTSQEPDPEIAPSGEPPALDPGVFPPMAPFRALPRSVQPLPWQQGELGWKLSTFSGALLGALFVVLLLIGFFGGDSGGAAPGIEGSPDGGGESGGSERAPQEQQRPQNRALKCRKRAKPAARPAPRPVLPQPVEDVDDFFNEDELPTVQNFTPSPSPSPSPSSSYPYSRSFSPLSSPQPAPTAAPEYPESRLDVGVGPRVVPPLPSQEPTPYEPWSPTPGGEGLESFDFERWLREVPDQEIHRRLVQEQTTLQGPQDAKTSKGGGGDPQGSGGSCLGWSFGEGPTSAGGKRNPLPRQRAYFRVLEYVGGSRRKRIPGRTRRTGGAGHNTADRAGAQK